MLDVAIVGAGELGGAVAHLLARAEIASSIRLVDEMGTIAAGKALDIMQAGPIESFGTRVVGTNDMFSLGGSSLIVVADRADRQGASAEWQGEEGLQQLRRVHQMAPHRPILCAGAAHLDLVEHGVRSVGIARDHLVGSAPEALAAALRASVALEADASPSDVSLAVLGRPPHLTIVPWGQATIGGLLLTSLLDEPAQRRLAARVAPLWPPGPHALAAAAVKALACLAGLSRELVSCFVAPDDSSGANTRGIALPARLGPAGLIHARLPTLDTHDSVALDNARNR